MLYSEIEYGGGCVQPCNVSCTPSACHWTSFCIPRSRSAPSSLRGSRKSFSRSLRHCKRVSRRRESRHEDGGNILPEVLQGVDFSCSSGFLPVSADLLGIRRRGSCPVWDFSGRHSGAVASASL